MSEQNESAADNEASEFLWKVHGYTNEYIRFADTKAGFVAGISAALVGSLSASSMLDSCWVSTPAHWSKLQWAGIVGLLLLSVALFLSIVAIRPRLWNKTSIGFIFWESITGHGDAKEFTKQVRGMSQRERTIEVSHHLYAIAEIAKRKYAYVDWALRAGIPGGALSGLVLLLHHARH